MPSAPKKTGTTILDSHNDCIGALKGNQSGLLAAVFANFQPQATTQQINKGHGRIEKRTVSISHLLEGIPDFPGLQTLIRVESAGGSASGDHHGSLNRHTPSTLPHLSIRFKLLQHKFEGTGALRTKSIMFETYGGGEDSSGIGTPPLVQIWAIARN